jgi:hypothetical protein
MSYDELAQEMWKREGALEHLQAKAEMARRTERPLHARISYHRSNSCRIVSSLGAPDLSQQMSPLILLRDVPTATVLMD